MRAKHINIQIIRHLCITPLRGISLIPSNTSIPFLRHGLRRLMLLNQLLRRAVVVLAGELAEAGDCYS